jgi:hypothetical protein
MSDAAEVGVGWRGVVEGESVIGERRLVRGAQIMGRRARFVKATADR